MPATTTDGTTYVATRDIPLDELTPFPGNAKRGDVDAIRASLKKNGQYRSLVVREIPNGPLIVLAGNHTMQALTAGGHETARCEIVHCDDATARRINPADNRTAELGTYDTDALAALLAELDGDTQGTGYTEDDIRLFTAGPPSLDELADEYGDPDPADLWPTLTFKVAPETRDAFYALTDDAGVDDDSARFTHLVRAAQAGRPT